MPLVRRSNSSRVTGQPSSPTLRMASTVGQLVPLPMVLRDLVLWLLCQPLWAAPHLVLCIPGPLYSPLHTLVRTGIASHSR